MGEGSTKNKTPEEEDEGVGTRETTEDWAMSGVCQADGATRFAQTYKESKPGARPSTGASLLIPRQQTIL